MTYFTEENKKETITEMCDICSKSYDYKNIVRIHYYGKNGYTYIIRCCPNCINNTKVLTQYL